MLAILNLWLKTMMLIVLCFIGNDLHNLSKQDYTDKLSNIEKVLNDMNNLDIYSKGKR